MWKKIKDYENYSVSDDGNVRNNKKGKILKKCKDSNGYEVVTLYQNKKPKIFKVHRLVALAFIPNPYNLPYIDHINTIRDDNRIENLRWCTNKENCNNPLTLENRSKAKKGEKHPMYGKHHSEETKEKMSNTLKGGNNPRCRKVILLNTGEVFDYIKQAEEKYGVANQSISACCNGKLKSAGKDKNGNKLIWMYYEDYLKMMIEEGA